MRRRPFGHLAVTAAIVLIAASTLTLATAQVPAVPPADEARPGQVLNVAMHPFASPGPTNVTEKVPLLEVFTATWCPPCAPAHGAIERLMDERSPRLGLHGNESDPVTLGLLSYHPFPDIGSEDPFGIPEGHDRLAKKHNVFWFPSAYVDGVLEDAPETRSREVDVGMEERLYLSYKGLVEAADTVTPPFTLHVTHAKVGSSPPTWDVHVRLTATARIHTPLLMQGVLFEDHVAFPGSSGVERHRMVVRDMAAPQHSPGTLQAGDTWEATLRLVTTSVLDPDRTGAAVIIEAAWGEERDDRAGALFTLAAVTAGGIGAVAGLQVRAKNRRRGHGNRRARPEREE